MFHGDFRQVLYGGFRDSRPVLYGKLSVGMGIGSVCPSQKSMPAITPRPPPFGLAR